MRIENLRGKQNAAIIIIQPELLQHDKNNYITKRNMKIEYVITKNHYSENRTIMFVGKIILYD